MRDWQSQSHVRWYCKYHIVFVPKYRRRVIYGQLRRSIGRIIRELCQQQGVELVEGHAMLITCTGVSAFPQNIVWPIP